MLKALGAEMTLWRLNIAWGIPHCLRIRFFCWYLQQSLWIVWLPQPNGWWPFKYFIHISWLWESWKMILVLSFALVGTPETYRALEKCYFLWVFYFYVLFYSVVLAQTFIYETEESNFKQVGGKARRASLWSFRGSPASLQHLVIFAFM